MERRYEKTDLDKAVETLRAGGVILYPTDTVWGLGCDATNAEAVEKIYKIKKRADAKAMLCLVDSIAMLDRFVDYVPEAAEQLIEVAVNPLTIIYDKPEGVAENLCAPDGSLGIRITGEAFSAALCRRLRRPIVSTSANISGAKTPQIFTEIAHEIVDAADYVVEFRRDDTSRSRPSNIIKVSGQNIVKVIR